MLLAPLAIGVVAIKSISLPMLRYFGYKRLLIINTMAVACLLWSFGIITGDTSKYLIGGLMFIFGILISLQYSSMNSLGYAETSAANLSAATSILSTLQQISQSIGVAIAALSIRYFAVAPFTGDSLTVKVFHDTFYAMGTLTLISVVIFMKLKPEDGQEMINVPKS